MPKYILKYFTKLFKGGDNAKEFISWILNLEVKVTIKDIITYFNSL